VWGTKGFYRGSLEFFHNTWGDREVLFHMDKSVQLMDYSKSFLLVEMIFENNLINPTLMLYLEHLCLSMETGISGKVYMLEANDSNILSLSIDLMGDHCQEVGPGSKCHGDSNLARNFGMCGEVEGSQSLTQCCTLVPKEDD
jgi:hypothetical protein